MPAAERRALLAVYKSFELLLLAEVGQPLPYSRAIDKLGPAQDAFLCCCTGSSSSSTSTSSTSSISSSGDSAVQSFFRKRRYVYYFVVQEEAQEQQQQDDKLHERQQQVNEQQSNEHKRQQQGNEHQELKRQSDYKQRLALLSLSWETLKRKDSEAINCIAEETSAKDRTGWFKRTRWDEHLQAYPDWKLLSYAIRPPSDNEPELKQVVLAVEQLVEQAVHGLSTLLIDTLRWLRSAKPNKADTQPLSQMQNKSSQQRAARL
ncbi:hypothetical protein EK21DRAFT_92734 [Setomelanomma holmii]|uniref:Uncharacterized protein n=1 Tax=Setomelanomma holmii TaxID=210430 RepID=A0A9P4H0G1_9PLEO|nr:hypothetical protein EK21DRAFT_92734 [Setomelanomma holmii]